MSKSSDIGLIGLAVMGQNLALNIADHGYKISVYNRTYSKTENFLSSNTANNNLIGFESLRSFVDSLQPPKKIIIMVQAGKATDAVIDTLVPLLKNGDIIIDGGNAKWTDTISREKSLKEKNILFVGSGVSGGEEGARFGPSLMPGGSKEAWNHISSIWNAISAKVDENTGKPLEGASPGKPIEGGVSCSAYIGENGAGQNRTGKGGDDLILKVPLGTQVFEEDNKTLLYDFTKIGEEFVVANGGKGGLGNTRFKSSTNRAPKKYTKGIIGEEFVIWLQLKTIADIGIIGLPNAGKSSLLAAITNANPKIANYQFTTLNPNLGVASYDDKEITIADIPGLIEGAHQGTGLGIQFLKHIERCKSLLHLIDITNENLVQSYNQVKNELQKYSLELTKKKELVVLNKIDLIDKNIVENIVADFSKDKKCEVLTLSTLEKNSVSKIKAKLITYAS